MPHGYPDYGAGKALSDVFASLDVGELAARLGSFDLYDRRGRVILSDGFEEGIHKWYDNLWELGDSIVCLPGVSRSAGYCAAFTLGAVATAGASLSRGLCYPQLSTFGLEVAFALVGGHCNVSGMIQFVGIMGSGTAGFTYDAVANSLYVFDLSGVVFTVPIPVYYPSSMWHWMLVKFVVNRSTGKWVRLRVGGTTYDLSGYNLTAAPVGADYYLGVVLEVVRTEAGGCIVYMDDVLLTGDE